MRAALALLLVAVACAALPTPTATPGPDATTCIRAVIVDVEAGTVLVGYDLPPCVARTDTLAEVSPDVTVPVRIPVNVRGAGVLFHRGTGKMDVRIRPAEPGIPGLRSGGG